MQLPCHLIQRLVYAICIFLTVSGVAIAHTDHPERWTVADLLVGKPRPFVMSHRGYG